MDSGQPRDDANAPSYDSSDEWEIGLGNLIIDLDADLEKDGQHEGIPAHLDTSPMKVGKMKIKRKVSSNVTKSEGVSPITVRKDSNASTGSSSTGSSTPEEPSSAYSSPDISVRTEEKSENLVKNVPPTGQSGVMVNLNRDVNASMKHDKPAASMKHDKPAASMVVMTVAASNQMLVKSATSSPANPSPVTALVASSPAQPSSAPAGEGKQHKTAKGPEDGEGDEAACKKMKMDKDSGKGDTGKRSGGEPAGAGGGRKYGGKKAKVDKVSWSSQIPSHFLSLLAPKS